MEKSAKTIAKDKFIRLPARRGHALLAELAETALAGDPGLDFRERYETLVGWAQLDGFRPPPWLSEREALAEYAIFHRGLAGLPPNPEASPPPRISWLPRFPVWVVLDQVRSPFNLGSILRLIDNFGLAGLIHGMDPFPDNHPQLRRAARGSDRWIPVVYEKNLPHRLETSTLPVIAVETGPDAVPVGRWQPPSSCLLLLGNEAYGISRACRDHADQTVTIPMFGYKKSMNVHHALAVIAQKIVEFTP